MPGRPFQSKLKPYESELRERKDVSPTYPHIFFETIYCVGFQQGLGSGCLAIYCHDVVFRHHAIMIKTQIPLEDWLYSSLKRARADAGRSLSDVVRERVSLFH